MNLAKDKISHPNKTFIEQKDRLDKELKDTLQYFWTEQNGQDAGAHITEVTKEEFLADPTNAGGNLLAKSDGISIRDGLTELASFGADGSRIGEKTGSRVATDTSGVRIYAEDDNSYAYVGRNGLDLKRVVNQKTLKTMFAQSLLEVITASQETLDGASALIQNYSDMPNGSASGVTVAARNGEAMSDAAYIALAAYRLHNGTAESYIDFRAINQISSNLAITVISDKRLKTHVKYLEEDAVHFCQSLKPALFIKDGRKQLGFYAQDVKVADTWDADITPTCTDGHLGLNYTELIAPLVAYCQSLEKRIKELEEKNG